MTRRGFVNWKAHLLPSGMVIWVPGPEVTYGTPVLPVRVIPLKPEGEPKRPEGLAPYVTASWRRVAAAS